jgi:ATP-dependent DNA helicase RecQ
VLIDGPTMVISPLIALQQDQVENLEKQGTPAAAQVNSTVRDPYQTPTFQTVSLDGWVDTAAKRFL